MREGERGGELVGSLPASLLMRGPHNVNVEGLLGFAEEADPRSPHLPWNEPEDVELRREPDNASHANAIAIDMLDDGDEPCHVGYLARYLADTLAPLMDSGSIELEARVRRKHVAARAPISKAGAAVGATAGAMAGVTAGVTAGAAAGAMEEEKRRSDW